MCIFIYANKDYYYYDYADKVIIHHIGINESKWNYNLSHIWTLLGDKFNVGIQLMIKRILVSNTYDVHLLLFIQIYSLSCVSIIGLIFNYELIWRITH